MKIRATRPKGLKENNPKIFISLRASFGLEAVVSGVGNDLSSFINSSQITMSASIH